MDREALKKAMKTSISEVLETMFFMPSEISGPETDKALLQIPPEKLKCVMLNFQGPIAGDLFLLIPRTLASSLTADFMGQEPDEIGQEDVEGTIKELLNMICGKALSLFDEKAVFKIGIPETVDPGKGRGAFSSDNENDIMLAFDTIDDHLAIKIVIR